jgi:rfaE bifunctional protein nucleotidyltransferase chain/domain
MNKSDLISQKILNGSGLQRKINLWRLREKKIVFTNGCFDLLHAGHIHLLAQAAGLGNVLVVGLNTDNSVKRLKGNGRPIQDEHTRAQVLASLFYVDAVVLFEDETPEILIKTISPDVLVKGGDYSPEQVVGADWVTQHGGRVEIIPLLPGHSTSKLAERMRDK